MVKVKVANPGPAALMVLNGRKTMRKRRTTRRRARRTTTTPNPPRRRRRRSYSLRRRAPNPTFRRRTHRRRRRNPASTGLFAKGLALAAGAALVQFTLGFIPPIGGVSPLADAARTAAVGWGLGTVMDRMGKSSFIGRYGDDVTLAGFTLAGGKLISSFILPFANRLFTRPTAPPSNGQAQMAGIAPIYRGFQPYGAYGGLNGIAMIDPAMQPYGEYAG